MLSYLRQSTPACNQPLDRPGLEGCREPSPGSLVCHTFLLGVSGSLTNPPLLGGMSSNCIPAYGGRAFCDCRGGSPRGCRTAARQWRCRSKSTSDSVAPHLSSSRG